MGSILNTTMYIGILRKRQNKQTATTKGSCYLKKRAYYPAWIMRFAKVAHATSSPPTRKKSTHIDLPGLKTTPWF
jgi:hypothetical protein